MRRGGHRAIATTLSAAAVVLCASRADASPFEFIGHDPDTGALAGSTVAYGDSIGVLSTNPALLIEVPTSVSLSLLTIVPRLHVAVSPKPKSTDVPLSIYDSNVGTAAGVQDRALPTRELPSSRRDTFGSGQDRYLALGVAHDLGIDKFKLGFLIELPVSSSSAASVATHYDDEREGSFGNRLHFTRFGEWDRILGVIAGAAYRPWPWLSVGLAGEFAASAQAHIRVYIPDAAVQSYAQSNMETDVASKLRPIVGLRATPLDGLALGVTFRGESYFKVDGVSELTLWNYHEPDADRSIPKRTQQTFPVVFGYEPMELSFGAGVKVWRATLQASATWERWSRFLDNHGMHPEDLALSPADRASSKFHDVVSLKVGAQLRYARWGEARFGFAWYPTPVPAQIGRTSFVDGDVIGVTAGNRWDFTLGKKALSVAFTMQLFGMLPRTTNKDPTKVLDEFPDGARTLRGNAPMAEASGLQTNSPGFPGYRSSGLLMTWGVSITHRF